MIADKEPPPYVIEVRPRLFLVHGRNQSRFPYCSCLYARGRDLGVLIDAGMGSARMPAVREMGIDVLILSHCHLDHRLTRREIPDMPVWSHEAEAGYLEDTDRFINALGLHRGGFDLSGLSALASAGLETKVRRRLTDGETIDLGGLTLQVIHTPGHTPGHSAFYFPESDFLYTADVDLTPFGPYYGHDFADIDRFIGSIRRLKAVDAGMAATGHAGPFDDDIGARFDAYEAIIHQRERLIWEHLARPRSLGFFKGRGLIYRTYPEPREMNVWFELIHITKHLERMAYQGRVRSEDGLWFRV